MTTQASNPLKAPDRAAREHAYATLRRDAPVSRLDTGEWLVTSQRGVRAGLMAVDHFGGYFGNTGTLPEEETVLPGIPEPRHGAMRKLINSVLAYHQASRVEPFVRELAAKLVQNALAIAADGPVDLYAEVARPLPSTVIAHLLGVPGEDRHIRKSKLVIRIQNAVQ